jgi:hypothetical protein
MIEALVREFVPEPWVEGLDFSTLDRVNATYVDPHLEKKEGDMVWKLRRKDGEPVYVYLLIEFQSRSDRFMAVRLMCYISLLYLDLIDRGELASGKRLPLVIPLVVYNGDRRWRAPLELAELIELTEPAAEAYVPRLRYRVIDQGAYALKDLERREGLASVLFWLERNRNQGLVHRVADRLKRLLGRPEDASLRRAFAGWIDLVLPGMGLGKIPETVSLEEFGNMFEKRVQEWSREARREGEKKGEAKLLLRQLERKFGPLDADTRARVRKAESDRLLEWGERFVTAERLEQVFGD